LKALKRDIENMQVKAVEIAKSNSKSESVFQLVVLRELQSLVRLLLSIKPWL